MRTRWELTALSRPLSCIGRGRDRKGGRSGVEGRRGKGREWEGNEIGPHPLTKIRDPSLPVKPGFHYPS